MTDKEKMKDMICDILYDMMMEQATDEKKLMQLKTHNDLKNIALGRRKMLMIIAERMFDFGLLSDIELDDILKEVSGDE